MIIIGYVYKIVNLINDKIYIGITTQTIEQRFAQHISSSKYTDTILYKAIRKYGINNFLINIVEEIDNNLLYEKEKYYINLFNSIVPNGYNMTNGGENPPIQYGDLNNRANLSNGNVENIIELLLSTTITFMEIAEKFNVHTTTIERINNGKIRYNKILCYPLRKYSKYEEIALNIIEDLLNTKLTNKEIAQKYNVGEDIPSRINTGKRYLYLHNYNIPLRNRK